MILRFTFVFCLLFSSGAYAEPSLLMEGLFHSDEVDVQDGDDVWVLYKDGKKSYLKQDKVSVALKFDEVVDQEGQMSAKDVVLHNPMDDVVVVMAGLDFEVGVVEQGSFVDDCGAGFLDQGCLVSFDEDVSKFEMISKREADMDMSLTPYVYDLSYKGVVLKDVYQILWVGDLDRDGKLDVLVDSQAHYNTVYRYDLYLSSQAKEGEALGLAAQLWAVGC